MFLEKNRSSLIALGSFLILLFAFIGMARRGYIDMAGLIANKDAIGAVSSVSTTALLAIGAIISYYKFFKGRTFSMRADLSVQTDVIPAPDGGFLHATTFTVKNIGTMAIWNPKPAVEVETEGVDGPRKYAISGWLEEPVPDAVKRSAVIDAGECANFFIRHRFAKDIWAVTYIASVSSREGDVWVTSKSVANSSKQ